MNHDPTTLALAGSHIIQRHAMDSRSLGSKATDTEHTPKKTHPTHYSDKCVLCVTGSEVSEWFCSAGGA